MSNDPLATYLQDHLAGAASAVELLEMLRDQHEGESAGALLQSWSSRSRPTARCSMRWRGELPRDRAC